MPEVVVLDANRDNWEAIESGSEAPTWAAFLGVTDGATHLTPAGAALVPRMASDLTMWFGSDWLPSAIGPGPRARIAWLRRYSPTLTLNGDHGAAAAFVEIVAWWAALMIHTDTHGIRQVRIDLRSDVSTARLLHTLTQTRLAAMASAAGMRVRFEPRPGDLLVSADGVDVTVEVFAMRSAAALESQEELSRQMFEIADDISRRHGVHLTGQLPPIDTDIAAWGRWVEQRAADVARIGIALTARWDVPATGTATGTAAGNARADSTTRPGVAAASAVAEVTVAPGSAPTGAELVGPKVELDIGSRIRAHAKTKARQVAGAPAAWLWVENHGAVDLLATISSAPLTEQLAAYEALLGHAAAETASVRGLTFSGAGRRRWPPPPPEHAVRGEARAVAQPVPFDRVRTTYHLPGTGGTGGTDGTDGSDVTKDGAGTVPAGLESQMMWRLTEQAPIWLDVALASIGVAPVADLVTPTI